MLQAFSWHYHSSDNRILYLGHSGSQNVIFIWPGKTFCVLYNEPNMLMLVHLLVYEKKNLLSPSQSVPVSLEIEP